MNDWRNDPATENQKKRMREDGINFSENITKGEASDLIGSLLDPEEEQISILKFFKIKNISKFSQTEARLKIEELFNDEEKLTRWKNRPLSKEQKEILTYFKVSFPNNINHKEAQKIIDEIFEDEAKLDDWENRQDQIDELENWFEDYHEIINMDNDFYNSRKIGKKLFRKVVEELEANGFTKNEIEKKSELVFKKAIEMDPNLIKSGRANKTNSYNVSSSNNLSTSNKGCLIIFFFLTAIPMSLYFLI